MPKQSRQETLSSADSDEDNNLYDEEEEDDEEQATTQSPNKTGNATEPMTTIESPAPVRQNQSSRRKSTLFAPTNTTLDINNDDEEKRNNRRKRKSVVPSSTKFLASTTSRKSGAHRASTTSRSVSASELEELFANCIKLSTENKITTKNAWELNLIDYIGQVLGSNLGGGTFQTASCTLDAGVKIYSTRVDSIHSETYKVLGSFARTQEKGKTDETVDNNQEGKESEDKTKKKRVKYGVNTLESNVNNITVKKLDLNYMIEPLYHNSTGSSNNFDVGSANSLLLNNLGLGLGCEVIIDSKSWDYTCTKIVEHTPHHQHHHQQPPPPFQVEEEVEEHANNITLDKSTIKSFNNSSMVVEDETEDNEQNPPITTTHSEEKTLQEEETQQTNPIEHQPFDTTNELGGLGGDSDIPSSTDDIPPDEIVGLNMTQEIPHKISIGCEGAALINAVHEVGGLAPDHFENVDHEDDDDDEGLFDTDFNNPEPSSDIGGAGDGGEDAVAVTIGGEKQKENEKQQSFLDLLHNDPESLTVDDDYAYFDVTKIRHWSGIDHWKPTAKSTTQTNKKVSKKRTQKEAFQFDFLTDGDKIDFGNDFKISNTNQMSENSISAQKPTLLPEDFHYDLATLLKPFKLPPIFTNRSLKPVSINEMGCQRFNVEKSNQPLLIEANKKQKTVEGGMNVIHSSQLYDESDEEEHDDQPMQELGGFDMNSGHEPSTELNNNAEPIMDHQQDNIQDDPIRLNDSASSLLDEKEIQLATQNINSTVNTVGGEKLIEAPKKVSKLNIKYESKAKQVDVRALKDHLWKEIRTCDDKKLDFSNVVSTINTSKPKEGERKPDFSEASIPFCFICMLHICNEQNLELEGRPDFSDFSIVKPKSVDNPNRRVSITNTEEEEEED